MLEVLWNKETGIGDKYGGTFRSKDGDIICKIQTWAMNCCGIWELKGFNSYIDVDGAAFWEALVKASPFGGWQPLEYIFTISDSQKSHPLFRSILKHPNVRLRDKFANKAHGPSVLYVYRYSHKGDFPRRSSK